MSVLPMGSEEKPAGGRGWRTVPMPAPGDREMSLSNSDDITGLRRERERVCVLTDNVGYTCSLLGVHL